MARKPDTITTLEHADGHTSELRIFDAAEPKGLVLILPGIAVGARYYDPIAAAFADAGFTTASTELPGQGTSTIGVGRKATPTGYHDAAAKDFPLAVDTLRAHTQRANLPLYMLGHSQGGQLAAYYAAREAIVGTPGHELAGIIGVATQSPFYRGYAPQVGRRLRLGSVVLPLGAGLFGAVPAAFFGGEGLQPGRRIIDWSKLVRTGRMNPAGADVNYAQGMTKVRTPALALTLPGDELAPQSAARYWLDFFPGAPRTMRHIDADLGHNKWARTPEPILAAVLDWISKVPAA